MKDYEKMYHSLYKEVAKLLVKNRTEKFTPYRLLSEWDKLRSKVENQNKDE